MTTRHPLAVLPHQQPTAWPLAAGMVPLSSLAPRAFQLTRERKPEQLLPLLQQFATHTLAEVGEQSLLTRYDTKFLLPLLHLPEFLVQLRPYYTLLAIDDRRVHGYETIYLDTPDFTHYLEHHNRRARRNKVRLRNYVGTDRHYLELKSKNCKQRTEKRRIAVAADISDQQVAALLQQAPFAGALGAQPLQRQVSIEYLRISLWERLTGERVTIDVGLKATTCDGLRTCSLDALAIVELKQGALHFSSVAADALRRFQVRATPISKYCVACALLFQDRLKHNRFKRLLGRLAPYLHHNNDRICA